MIFEEAPSQSKHRKETIVPDEIKRIDYFYVTLPDKPSAGERAGAATQADGHAGALGRMA